MLEEQFRSGRGLLLEIIDQYPVDFQTMDLVSFREWLETQWQHKQKDPIFLKRCEIRDLQKQHWDKLRSLRGALKSYQQEFEASALFQQLEQLRREQIGVSQAIAGLEGAVASSNGGKKEALVAKLQGFLQKKVDLENQETQWLAETPIKLQRDMAEQSLTDYKQQIGLTGLEQELEELQKSLSRRVQSSGVRFEDRCKVHVEEVILSQLQERGPLFHRDRVHVLSRVTLGAADTEIDNLVVECAEDPNEPVTVLAVVEAKRNINDVGSGFLMRQQNLGFLCGIEALYDPEKHKTQLYREGRFDRLFTHQEDGQSYVFASSSFRHFAIAPEVGYIMDRLYFVTQYRSLVGLDSEESSRLLYRMSTDVHFDLDDPEYLASLLESVREQAHPIQTRHVLVWYAQQERWAEQFFILSRS